MRKLELEEIKKLSFEVLCAVRDFCEVHSISYSLTGGTLIGAVRHQGFIPWDDDIDIMMPRPDYDRFIHLVAEEKPWFRLSCVEHCGDAYGYPFAKANHPDTVVRENAMSEMKNGFGVFVDIFPIDGAGNTYFTAKLWVMLFQFIHGLKVTSNWTEYHRSKLRKWYYEPFRYVCYRISKILSRKQIDSLLDGHLRKISFSQANYVGRLVGDYGSKEVMPKAVFEGKTKLLFEGQTFDAIANYDFFLTRLYGNYMQMPPAEKQITHHEFEAYLLKQKE